MPDSPLHSVVVPVYNEIEVVDQFHERCSAAMDAIGDTYEIVYVDDGSSDGSWRRMAEIAEGDPRVRLVRLSRNFGHQIAISAGIQYAAGDTVTVIDADLQDPPEVIAQFVEAWRQGADIVYGVRTERRGETWFKRASASAFYKLLGTMADVAIPEEAGDFRLLSRRAVNALVSMPEHDRYVRGLVAWMGYESASVPYARDSRAAGQTKYPLAKMIRLATDGIMAFSTRPLRVATWIGMLVSMAAFLTAIVLIVMRLFGDIVVEGWTSLAVLVLLLAGVQLLTIGALGEYIGRIYAEVRQRPLYLVRDEQGFPIAKKSSGAEPERLTAEE